MKVNIYLSYYNGSKYIDEQIASLLNQKNVDVHIYIRDDGSDTANAAYIDKYQNNKKIEIIHSENFGFGKSFMWLANKTTEKADFYAFCDQDDVWLDFKLERACNRLKNYTEPAVYSALPQYVDSNLYPLQGCSSVIDPLHFDEMSVDDAIGYQFLGLGCTFVWNNALNDILRKIDLNHYCFAHDNFLSVLGPCIGIFYRDNFQVLLYRQHNKNASGNKKIKSSYLKKLREFLNGYKHPQMFLMRKYIFEEFAQYIHPDKRDLLNWSVNYRKNFFCKLKLIKREMKLNDWNRKIKNIIEIMANWY